MKKILSIMMVLAIALMSFGGCNKGEEKGNTTSLTKEEVKVEKEEIPTLEEVISGTWNVYAGSDQSGNLVYADNPDSSLEKYALTFDANGGFSGVYREKDGFVDASFSGTYDVTNSMAADKNPYRWYYYCTIERGNLSDSGDYIFSGRLPAEYGSHENAVYLAFKFRELEEQQMLFEEAMGLYFKK